MASSRPASRAGRARPSRVDGRRLDTPGVDHRRLDRGDIAVVHISRIPALRHRRTTEQRGVHLHDRRRHAAAPNLFDQVADPRRTPIPGVLVGWRSRQRRIPGAHQHDRPLGVLAASHHTRADPGLAVQRQQRRGRRQDLVGRRRHQRHVVCHLPKLFSGHGVGDPAPQACPDWDRPPPAPTRPPARRRWVSRRCRLPGPIPA